MFMSFIGSFTTEFKPKTLIKTEYRTKSSRQKRKCAADEPIKNKKQRVQDNTCVIFNVPEFEMGRYGEDKYQERKYLGLIEGVGGGVGTYYRFYCSC